MITSTSHNGYPKYLYIFHINVSRQLPEERSKITSSYTIQKYKVSQVPYAATETRRT